MNSILLYIIPRSRACEEAQRFLRRRRVRFRTVDVTKPANARRLIKTTGQLAVPVLTVGERSVVGYDPHLFETLLAKS